jgi:hypothetical protein
MRSFRHFLGLLTVVMVSGCASTTTLQVTQKAPLVDQSVPTPQKPAYAIVMVLPPKGSERGQVSELAQLEKELLKRGVRVISSGVTGRVVIDNAEGKKNEGAAQLTDLERALILARNSGAEALLQVVTMEWEKQPNNYRHYLLESDGQTFAEVSKQDYESSSAERQWMITGQSLHFEAKVIDVESAEIVAAIDISQSTAHELSSKIVPITVKGGAIASNPALVHATDVDSEDLKMSVAAEMMSKLASIIAAGKAHDPRPSAKEVALAGEKKKCEEALAKSESDRQRLADNETKRAEEDRKRAEAAAAEAAALEAAKKSPVAIRKK